MDYKIELDPQQSGFIHSLGNMFREGRRKSYFVAKVFIDDNENNGIYTVRDLSDLSKNEMMDLGIANMFTLEEMKACALAMANWGEGFEGALSPNEYFNQVLGIDISE